MDQGARGGSAHGRPAAATADRDEVRHAFERELAAHGSEPEYTFGIWRVLAQAASGDRDAWVRRIADAFLDAAGPDRLHASESLGKLGYRARADELDAFERAARGGANPLAANALWVLVNTGDADAEPRLADLLTAGDVATRATASCPFAICEPHCRRRGRS